MGKFLGIVLFLFTFFIYLSTLSPSVYVGDSGELITGAYTIGVSHPPGYPLYVLSGKVFSLIPIANIAYRMNLMSAAFASLTVFLLFSLIIYLINLQFRNPHSKFITSIIALSSALFFAFSNLFWSQAVFAEVFTLNTFLAVFILFLLIEKKFFLSAFICGIGTGNHHTILLCVPVLLYCAWILKNKKLTINFLFFCGLFFLLGLSIYVFIPVRSLSHPIANWGHTDTLNKLLRMFLREDYGGTFNIKPVFESLSFISALFARIFSFLSTTAAQFMIFGFIIAIIGFIIEPFKISLSLFIITGMSLPFLLNVYLSPGIKTLTERFYILPIMFTTIGIAFGIQWILKITKVKTRFLIFLAPVIFSIPAFSLIDNYHENDRSKNYIIYNYGMNILDNIKNESVVFIYEGDAVVNSLVYLTKVERRSPTVKLYESEIRLLDNPYGNDYIYLTKSQRKLKREKTEMDYIENSLNNVYFVTVGLKEKENFISLGLMYQAIKNNLYPGDYPAKTIWKKYDLRGIFNSDIYKEFRIRTLVSNYHYRLALYYTGQQEMKEKVMQEIEKCSKEAFDMEWVQNNLGNFYSLHNMPDNEQKSYENAVKINPSFAEGYYNLGVVFGAKKQYDKAIEQYEKSIKVDALYAKAVWNLASVYSQIGNTTKIVHYMRMYTKIAPHDKAGVEEANRIINSLLQREKN